MAENVVDEDSLPLDEFVKLPTTVDFQTVDSIRLREYIKGKPHLHFGTELANNYIVGYTNQKHLASLIQDMGNDFLSFYPKILSPLESNVNDSSGITQILNQPYLNLSGRGVIVGIVDTGIDYTKDTFKFEDGSSKILSLWDQTLDGPRHHKTYFGATYDQKQINEALQSKEPHTLVPSIDEDGHGTFLASIAAGNQTGEFTGAAPKAGLVVVKLRRASDFYIKKYLLPADNPNLYESTDYLLGIKYILDRADDLDMPAVICIGMGSNYCSHAGDTAFEKYITFISGWAGYAFVTAAGNEASAKHHTQGKIPVSGETDTISIRVGKPNVSFRVLIYGPGYDKISVGITSPTGEVLPRVPFKSGFMYDEKLIMENTTLSVRYYKNTNNNIVVGFQNATQGIWDITLFGDSIINGDYWAWLPITGQISEGVDFLKPFPEYTIVYPATAQGAIACGAYNNIDNSLYASSSWGPTRLPQMAPDLVAPGVNVMGVYPTGYGTRTGTSVATAITAGASALLLEWGVVQGNIPTLDGDLIRNLLISGCTRDSNMIYPNIKWGYGKLNLEGTFEAIKESILHL